MKIAMPVNKKKLCSELSNCEKIAIFSVNDEDGKILHREEIIPPIESIELLPEWLNNENVNIIIAGGINERVRLIFIKNGIEICIGKSGETAEELIKKFLYKNIN